MLPAEVLDPQPGERILDLCAAPGGKSTQIGIKMKGEGLLVCNEPVPKRAQILSRNIERMGIPNSVVTCMVPADLPHAWDECFDGVLADAPCSGEGMFRRDPETRREWSEEAADGCAKRQEEILEEAARLVRPGGRLVYSTCTYNPAENEGVVNRFLEKHPEFETEAFRLPGAEGKDGTLLCLPHRMRGEGQFAALLRKKGSGEKARFGIPFAPPDREAARVLRETVPGLQEPNATFGNTLIRIPECPEMKGIRVLRAGLHLAEARGKILIPDHAAALGGRIDNDVPVTELGREDAARYLSGLSVEGDAGGWTVLRYRGLPLGWGKGSGGQIKNHYPKGLRKERILTEP
jgi:NOL1/NOP2/fmu family ribosome biogenesis protein/precorrin-6B methylase 2